MKAKKYLNKNYLDFPFSLSSLPGFLRKTSLLAISTLAFFLGVEGRGIKESYAYMNTCDVNLVDQLGSVRNQGKEGLCWNYAATAAMRQYLVDTKNPMMKDGSSHLSILDSMACADKKRTVFRAGAEAGQGGRPEWALNCIKDKGACLEKDAPIEKYEELMSNKEKKRELEACRNQKEQEIACRPQNAIPAKAANKSAKHKASHPILGLPFLFVEDIPKEIGCFENEHLYGPEASCIYNKVITDECKNNRIKIPGTEKMEIKTIDLSQMRKNERKDKLTQILNHRRAPVLAICLDKVKNPELKKSLGLFRSDSKKCQNPHAVTVGGMRCDGSFYIHNSWGPDAPFHGWIPGDQFLDAIMDVTYIKDQK